MTVSYGPSHKILLLFRPITQDELNHKLHHDNLTSLRDRFSQRISYLTQHYICNYSYWLFDDTPHEWFTQHFAYHSGTNRNDVTVIGKSGCELRSDWGTDFTIRTRIIIAFYHWYYAWSLIFFCCCKCPAISFRGAITHLTRLFVIISIILIKWSTILPHSVGYPWASKIGEGWFINSLK